MKKQDGAQLKQIIENLINPTGEPHNYCVDLSTFKQIYYAVLTKNSDAYVDIVINRTWAIAQFSSISNNRVRIQSNFSNNKLLVFLGYHQYIEKRDFDFIDTPCMVYGQKIYLTPIRFFLEEVNSNWLIFLILLCFSYLSLTLSYLLSQSLTLIKTLNDILLQSLILFLTIFILFTVSQNIKDIQTPSFSKEGLIHRFALIDKYLACEALVCFIFTIFNRVSLDIPFTVYLFNGFINTRSILIILTSYTFSLTVILLFSVINYYMERNSIIFETRISSEILSASKYLKQNKTPIKK
jgi:hypothetical protein